MHRVVGSAHHRFHEARADLFVQLMQPRAGETLLDLGGGNGSFSARICRRAALSVTIADIDTSHKATVEASGFRHVALQGSGRLPFSDGEFDYVLSNSVIEHVTLPKERCRTGARVSESEWKRESAARQRAFADEIRRVGRKYFVQTPHKHFPIDPHIYLPLVQYLPHNLTCRLVPLTDRLWLNDCAGTVDWHLLTASDMHRFFPDGLVRVERFFGMAKSIVAYRNVVQQPCEAA